MDDESEGKRMEEKIQDDYDEDEDDVVVVEERERTYPTLFIVYMALVLYGCG